MDLDQFDESPRQCPGVDECDPMTATAPARGGVDEVGAGRDQMSEGGVEIGHLNRQVVQTLPVFVQEPPHRSVGTKRCQHLQVRATQRHHGFFDSLLGHDLPGERLDPKEHRQGAEGFVEVPYCDGRVVQVDGEHRENLAVTPEPIPGAQTRRARDNPDMFDDLLRANARYREEFHDPGIPGTAARGLAVLTCIDSRISPLAMLGLVPGDAKILRNAGARVTPDALRSLILATNFLGVDRIVVVAHTDCAVSGTTDGDLRARLEAATGADTTGWEFLATPDPVATLKSDLALVVACPLIPADVVVGGFVFDVHRGALLPID